MGRPVCIATRRFTTRMSRQRFRLLALAALTITGALASVGGAAHGSPSRWALTHTQALRLRGQLLGAAPSGMPLQISVALPLRNQSEINALIQSRTVLSKAQARARFSPSPATVAAVTRYLAKAGFVHVSVAPDRLLVSGRATVAQAERAFDTTISTYRLGGQTVYANTRAASVPSALAGKVTAVLGLQDVPMPLPKLRATGHSAAIPAATGSPDLTGFTPQAIQHAYQADGMPAATATETAIIAGGDMTPVIKDLRGAEKYFKFPQVTVNVIPDTPYATDPANPLTGNLEWDLDTQYSTMMASSSTATVKALDVYDIGTFTDPEVARGINMFVSDDRASALSISLGECDLLAFLDGAMVTSDEALALGATQGQSSFSSTGDNGYACPEVASTGVPEGPPGDSWPAVGEYTVGAGGTSLFADSDGNVQEEIAWVGGGGGSDPWETAPPWTMQAYPWAQSWQYTNQGGRTIPDASAVADSTTPVLVYSGGSTTGVGGTSVASPVLEGLWDRVDNTSGDTFGLAQYDFYALYDAANPATIVSGPVGNVYVPATNPVAVSGFRDVVLGTNGGCLAKPGYDACTGIGTLQAADMAKALANPKLGIPLTPAAGSGSSGSGSSGSGTTGGPGGGGAGGSSSGSSSSAAPSSSGSTSSSSSSHTTTSDRQAKAKAKSKAHRRRRRTRRHLRARRHHARRHHARRR